MENDKTERLRMQLEQALKPIIDRLDRIEKQLGQLKEQQEKK